MARTPAEFTPPNVMMLNATEGVVPFETGQAIIQDVMASSVMMQLAKFEDMNALEKKFPVFLSGVGAYWVGEGKRIQTSKPEWGEVTMKAHKLGVILPTTREYQHYKASDYFEMMRPLIAEAFYKKFDMATILNVDNVWSQSLEQASTDERLVEGDLNADNINLLIDALGETGHEPNAYISKVANNSLLRGMVSGEGATAENIYDRSAKTLDGLPLLNVHTDLTGFPKGTLYAGDFNYAYYGIPYGISYSISDQATISTIVDEDGEPLNLWEREMVALRATMDIAFMIVREEAFGKISAPVVEEG